MSRLELIAIRLCCCDPHSLQIPRLEHTFLVGNVYHSATISVVGFGVKCGLHLVASVLLTGRSVSGGSTWGGLVIPSGAPYGGQPTSRLLTSSPKLATKVAQTASPLSGMSKLADFLVADAAALPVILLEPRPGQPEQGPRLRLPWLFPSVSLSVGLFARNLIRCFGECNVWFTGSLATQLTVRINMHAFFVINWCFKPFLRKKNLNQSYAHPSKLTLVARTPV